MAPADGARCGLAHQREALAYEIGGKAVAPQPHAHGVRLSCQVGIRSNPQQPIMPLDGPHDPLQRPCRVAQPVARRLERPGQQELGDPVMQAGLVIGTLGIRPSGLQLARIQSDRRPRHGSS